jgi:hypothetical protein
MSRKISRQQPSGEDTQALHELHQLSLHFLHRIDPKGELQYGSMAEFPRFVAWWRQLPPAVRQSCERDFRKGYAEVVAESERQVAAVLAKYKI